jgi:membrane associated rhomboid family serine protease
MGLYDREYVRLGPGSPTGLWGARAVSINIWIIVANIAVFGVQALLAGHTVPLYTRSEMLRPAIGNVDEGTTLHDARGRELAPGARLRSGAEAYRVLRLPGTGEVVGRRVYTYVDVVTAWGHFSTSRGFLRFEVWRLVTFQFVHANWIHLAFNMLGLYIFGGLVEAYLGAKRYAAFYLVCGIFGGLMYLVLNLLGSVLSVQLPGVLFNLPTMPLVGASAGVFGVIMAAAYFEPRMILQLIFPPVRLRMRTAAYIYVGMAAANLLFGGPNAGGDAAHLGGAIAGAFFVRRPHLLRDFFDVWRDSRRPGRVSRWAPGPDDVDRVLARAHQVGLNNLTPEERQVLRRASIAYRRRG